jgi:phospholipid/cholesterol/gamma-HCH transport system permease protein
MPGQLNLQFPSPDNLRVVLAGSWLLTEGLPSPDDIALQLQSRSHISSISFDGGSVTQWDSGLLTFLARVYNLADEHKIDIDPGGLPDGARRMMKLATAVPPKEDTGKHSEHPPLLERIGLRSLSMWRAAPEMLHFLGEVTLSFGRLFRGTAQFRRSDLMLVIEDVGAHALPIVSLISFLVGLIVAYMGAVQLAQFGAQIYIANLVSLGMTREMGALMTGIIMAGRTGAAFAAQLGTMQVNEEIDALRTIGLDPMEVLVLPRVLGLVIVMPLLTFYADIMGILGGGVMVTMTLDMSATQFLRQLADSARIADFWVGIIKAPLFAFIIAMVGCFEGMKVSRSAESVGRQTTRAVVEAIFLVIVLDAIFSIFFSVIGF